MHKEGDQVETDVRNETGHFSQPDDGESKLIGDLYASAEGVVYRVHSHHDCGYHLLRVGCAVGVDRDKVRGEHFCCVSDLALGSTYRCMFEEGRLAVKYLAEGGSEPAQKALQIAAQVAPDRIARFYRCGTRWYVEPYSGGE